MVLGSSALVSTVLSYNQIYHGPSHCHMIIVDHGSPLAA